MFTLLVLAVVVGTNSTLRGLLETLFAHLTTTFASELNVLLMVMIVAPMLVYMVQSLGMKKGQEKNMRKPARKRSRFGGSKALMGALLTMSGGASMGNAMLVAESGPCHPVAVGDWGVDFAALSFQLENLTFHCGDGDRVVDIVDFSLSNTGTLVCQGDEWVCSNPELQELLHGHEEGRQLGFVEIPEEEWKQVLIFIVCFLGIGCALEVFMIVCMSKSITGLLRRRERGEVTIGLQYPGDEGTDEQPLLSRGDTPSSPMISSIMKPSTNSVFASENVPTHAKFLVPLFLVVAIVMFFIANINVGASVEILVQVEYKPWSPFPWVHKDTVTKLFGPEVLFEFSLVNTITEMYKAGVYLLAMLVLVWSGIWPYLKLVLLIGCWFVVPRYLSATTRGRMLLVFDALGKWCLIDVFLMLLMSEAFHFYIRSDEIPIVKHITPPNFVILDVTVLSKWGMYGFSLAAMLSLLMNHVVLAYHRTATSNDVSKLIREGLPTLVRRATSSAEVRDLVMIDEETGAGENGQEQHNQNGEGNLQSHSIKKQRFCCPCPTGSWFGVGSEEIPDLKTLHFILNRKQAITGHVFEGPDGKRRRIGVGTKWFVVLLILVAFVFTIIGAFTESFEFTFTGLAAKLIKFAQPESLVRRYSLFTICESLNVGDETLDAQSTIGIFYLQAVYMIFAFVMPLIQCIFLLALWLIPMRLRDQKIVFDTTEIICSWAALDCFIVSIIAACVEINQFAQFLVGDRCDVIEDIFKEECFGIKTAFLPGCWYIVLAASLLFITAQIVQRVSERAIYDRELEVLQVHSPEDVEEERKVPSGFLTSFLCEELS